jgi:hypothetical protein
MTETFAALLFAHTLADFVFQTAAMVQAKAGRRPGPLLVHAAIVFFLSIAALGAFHPLLVALAVAHLAIDLAKSFAPRGRLWPFLSDQAAHLVTHAVVAGLAPGLWAGGLWAGAGWLASLMALAAGALIVTRAGGFAVGLLLGPYVTPELPKGLTNAGTMIGLLERGLIFTLVLVGQPAGIGFLIAAKSILRYGAATNEHHASEYVIIGTLASFGWAMLAAWSTLALLTHLAPIGIPGVTH